MTDEFDNEQRVEIVISCNGGDENRPWEGGLNGHFYRIKRGERVKVPKSIALLIEENENSIAKSKKELAPYCKEQGKRLC